MDNYIVFDLEWNQSPQGKEGSVEDFPFEIIEIGAVRLDEQFSIVDEFHRLIHPQVYQQMHFMISEVTHMDIQELRERGITFVEAAGDFLRWCGDAPVFCTWGSMDLTELQRNLDYYNMEIPFPRPLLYYDVQKLYGLLCREGEKVSLDTAVAELEIPLERPFHRALYDAYYTGCVMGRMDREKLLPYRSVDYYRLPEHEREEIRLRFPEYSKYVSCVFPSKEDAMKERRVTEMRCYECGRVLRKKVRWFTPNQKIYYGLAFCQEHGFLKGKIRIKRVDDEKVFVVKTLKLTDEEGAAGIMNRREEARKKRSQRNKAKRQRQLEEQGQRKR